MVFCFLVLSSDGHLLFSTFFCSGGNDFLKSERQQFISRLILDEFEFRKNCQETTFTRPESNALDWSLLSDKGKTEEGVFRIPTSEKNTQTLCVMETNRKCNLFIVLPRRGEQFVGFTIFASFSQNS